MVSPANSTLAAIRTKIRRLTASPSESTLPTDTIDEYINNFYTSDFPYGIKLDQMRDVYTFYTEPYKDKYPLDVNYNQGVRAPMYVDGIQGSFYKDRTQFYNLWPRFPTIQNITPTSLSGTITGFLPLNPVQVTSPNHGLVSGSVISISGVVSPVQLNGGPYTIIFIDANTFALSGVDGAAFGAYGGGGTWEGTSQDVAFTLPSVPFLRNEVTIGGVDASGNGISVCDDGNGNLLLSTPNPIVTITGFPPNPPYIPPNPPPTTAPIPGMPNKNILNPGLQRTIFIGTVDYVTGEISYTLPSGVSYAPGSQISTKVSQYQTGRPYTLLFWNNIFTVRPIPQHIHKVEIEVYLTPVEFMDSRETPILNQWWQYIAIGSAIRILQDRQDFEGVDNIMPAFKEQESLVLERQSIEEVGQRNTTLYTSTANIPYWNSGWGGGFY